ncbi:MAG: alpha/beta hydrolase family protein [Gemmatimonadaceae bacterium]
MRRIEVCGSGTFLFSLDSTPAGRETFTVACNADGSISGTGRTVLQLPGGGANADVETKLELSSELIPRSVMVKGTAAGREMDEKLVVNDSMATLTSAGRTQEIRFPKGASWLGGNIYYSLALILGRYDSKRGGTQKFPAFPVGELTITHTGRDSLNRVSFDRYTLNVAGSRVAVWIDSHGRMAVVAVPAARFTAALEEYALIASDLLEKAAPSVSSDFYAAPHGAPYTAEDVSIPVAGYTLAGTLTIPKTGSPPFPAAVLISGSGLQDRDSRISISGLENYRPFRQIADRLSREGVAVLRVDDRGSGKSTGAETLAGVTTSGLAVDVRAEVAYLRTRSEVDATRITLIGHSEGASIAPMVAANDLRIAGIILMAGVAKSGGEVSIEQQNDLFLRDTTTTDAEKESLRAQQREAVKTILSGGEVPGAPVNAWTREYFAYDPLVTIRQVRRPILILQGGLDRQVAADHAALLAEAARKAGNGDVTVKVFPKLNHLFLVATSGAFAEYSSLESAIVGNDVLDAITHWMKTH